MINEQKIRNLYLEHLGSVEAERAAATDEARFVILRAPLKMSSPRR